MMKGLASGAIWVAIWMAAVIFTVGFALIPFGLIAIMVFSGQEKRAEKANAILAKTLMRDEYIDAAGLQHRIFALWKRRQLIAVTKSRIISIDRGIFGG